MAKKQKKVSVSAQFRGPKELESAIKDMGSFTAATSRSEYSANKDTWRLYLDLMELDAMKLKAMIERHGSDETKEPEAKFTLRKNLATAINLIPLVLSVIDQYLFAEDPVLDAAGDEKLQAFIDDCDGNGTPFRDYVKRHALKLAMGLGWIDAFVEMPEAKDGESEEDQTPRIFTITPLQRINWSCKPNHAYDAIVFKDAAPEKSIFEINTQTDESYITLVAAGAMPKLPDIENAVWIRSSGGATAQVVAADYCPTPHVPVATLYYRQSVDPERRHWGVSKIAMMAVLTKAIIQLLSWTTEDILANLSLLAIPTKGGLEPKDEAGNSAFKSVNAFSTLFFDRESAAVPTFVQGDTSHIEIKLRLIDTYVLEILRLAHLIAAEGRADNPAQRTTSGFHAVVNRNELFRELEDLSGALDTFALDVFALVKSWTTGSNVTRAELLAGEKPPRASFHKGPFTIEPLTELIDEAKAVRDLFRDTSPTLMRVMLLKVAAAALYQDDPLREEVEKEIEENTKNLLAFASAEQLLKDAESGAGNPIQKEESDALDKGE